MLHPWGFSGLSVVNHQHSSALLFFKSRRYVVKHEKWCPTGKLLTRHIKTSESMFSVPKHLQADKWLPTVFMNAVLSKELT